MRKGSAIGDEGKSREQLMDELGALRRMVVELEAAHQQSANMLWSLVEAVPDIIYQLDAYGNILFINDAVTKYGYTPKELIGTSIFNLVHPEDREKATYRVNERRTGDRSTRSLEMRLLTKDHDPVAFEFKSDGDDLEPTMTVSAHGIYASEQPCTEKFLCTQGIARDVTDRVKAEKALREAERFKVFTETAGATAHEVGQPLTVIMGVLEIVLEKMDFGVPYRDHLEGVLKQAEKISEIVEKMLTAHRYVTKSYVRGEDIADFDASSQINIQLDAVK